MLFWVMNIIARLIFVTSLDPRFGIGIFFASGRNNFSPTSSLAYAGLMQITKLGPVPRIFSGPGSAIPTPYELQPGFV